MSSYLKYNLIEDKEGLEANKILHEALTFYSNIANNSERMEFMDIHLVDDSFASVFNDHLKNITQPTGNCHLVDLWADPSITDKYYHSMEKVLREMSLNVLEPRSSPANNNPST